MTSQISKMIVKRAKLAAILMPLVLVPQAPAQDNLPAGPGKELLSTVCTTCHNLTRVTEKKLSKDEWDDIVDKMAARGARASDEEFDTIVTYLVKNFGKQ